MFRQFFGNIWGSVVHAINYYLKRVIPKLEWASPAPPARGNEIKNIQITTTTQSNGDVVVHLIMDIVMGGGGGAPLSVFPLTTTPPPLTLLHSGVGAAAPTELQEIDYTFDSCNDMLQFELELDDDDDNGKTLSTHSSMPDLIDTEAGADDDETEPQKKSHNQYYWDDDDEDCECDGDCDCDNCDCDDDCDDDTNAAIIQKMAIVPPLNHVLDEDEYDTELDTEDDDEYDEEYNIEDYKIKNNNPINIKSVLEEFYNYRYG